MTRRKCRTGEPPGVPFGRLLHALAGRKLLLLVLLAAAFVTAVAWCERKRGPCGARREEPVGDAVVFGDEERRELSVALQAFHPRYDPTEGMLSGPIRSPGYHTRLRENTSVHPTRDSLQYAVALLDTGEEPLRRRAEVILARVLDLQDRNPSSKTYGIWPWFLEEPLAHMSPPDWNWADFCGAELMQVALNHRDRIQPDLAARVHEAVLHAARSIQRRDVGPAYTNIAVLGTYVTLVAAERYDVPDLRWYAERKLRRLHSHVMRNGTFSEFNSPTYTTLTLKSLGLLTRDVLDAECRALVEDLYRAAWQEIALHYHPPTGQWAGPHSRAYRTLLDPAVSALIDRWTGRSLDSSRHTSPSPEPPILSSTSEGDWMNANAALDVHRAALDCPNTLHTMFHALTTPRIVSRTYTESDLSVVGTTYLHPEFALGSISHGDLWNQRGSLVAHWGSVANPSYLRLRFLRDGYDFAAAQIFSAQSDGRVLAAVCFATDGGNRHPSFDRLSEGKFRATDLRLRFEFGGAAADQRLAPPAGRESLASAWCGPVRLGIQIPFASFDGRLGRWEAGGTASGSDRGASATSWLDLVLYSGPERSFSLNEFDAAALVLALELSTDETSIPPATAVIAGSELTAGFGPLTLQVPTRPAPAAALRAAFRGSNVVP